MLACNDPADIPLARLLFGDWFAGELACPQNAEAYFELLATSRAVVSGRLHTAVVSFSLGIPFALLDLDQRTHGFIQTYQLESWAALSVQLGSETRLRELTGKLLSEDPAPSWDVLIGRREQQYARAMRQLGEALQVVE